MCVHWLFRPTRKEIPYITGMFLPALVLWAILLILTALPTHAAGPEEIAYDGQSLQTQPPSVRTSFWSVFGANAPVKWVVEHAKELFDLSPWGYGWGWGGSNVSTFIYDRGSRRGGVTSQQRLLTAELYGPYTVQSYQFTLPSTLARYRGATGDSCETRVEPNLDYNSVVIRLGRMFSGRCDGFYSYPHLREGASGESVPVPHPTRPNEYPKVGVFGPGKFWNFYADDGSMALVFEVWGGQRKPTTQVRIPQGFGLEAKLPCDTCKNGVTFVVLWNDTQGWHYRWNMSSSEALQEGGPIWSLWRMNFLTLHEDGTVEFEELPFLLNPIHEPKG